MRRAIALTAAALVVLSATLGSSSLSCAQHSHGAAGHGGDAAVRADPGPARGPADDPRTAVAFPAEMREHTLANMRDHLLALHEIQSALAGGGFDAAAEVAERRLGMSSLALHGAHEVARFMPPGMQDAGTAMHRGASRFSVIARDGAVTGDLKPALSALAELTGTCVACHAGFRLSRRSVPPAA